MGGTVDLDDDCFHASGVVFLTVEDLLAHLLRKTALRSERLTLADRNGDGVVDVADAVQWLNNP
jgi:hypothetical protein